jgi:hypothetical protein
MLNSLPKWKTLPVGISTDILTGFVYGKMFKVNAELTAIIVGVYSVANRLLFHTADTLFNRERSSLFSHQIYIFTHTLCFSALTTALYHTNLMGKKGLFFMSAVCTLRMGNYCWQLYKISPSIQIQIASLRQNNT